MQPPHNSDPFTAFWQSFVVLPLWVKLWVGLLSTVNMASLAFISQPSGSLIAALVFAGIGLSMIAAIYCGGLSRLVGLGHIIAWMPLIFMLVFSPPLATGAHSAYLTLLLVINTVSLVFDINDFRLWLAGERAVFA